MSEPNLPAIRKRLAEWLGWPYAYDQWRPDERIEQAWMLLAKCIRWQVAEEEGKLATCTVWRIAKEFKASAPTAPLAITLAVYAAVGGAE